MAGTKDTSGRLAYTRTAVKRFIDTKRQVASDAAIRIMDRVAGPHTQLGVAITGQAGGYGRYVCAIDSTTRDKPRINITLNGIDEALARKVLELCNE